MGKPYSCFQTPPLLALESTNSYDATRTDEVGYYVASNDNFGMVSELMNMSDEPGDVMVTITYEYIPSPSASFAHVQPLWLDIGPADGCRGSDMPAHANSTFNYSSTNWVAKSDGRVTFMGSHLHDGGTHLEIQLNGDTVCNSVADYGQTPAYIDIMPMNMTMGGMTMEMNSKYSVGYNHNLTQC